MTGIITFKKLFILSLASFCQGALYISTRESYWANASSYCSMATPKITPTPTGYSVDVHDIELSDDEAVWIGYYRDFRIFEYMDCVKLGVLLEMNKSLQSFDIESSPDQCFPGCGHTSIVGVTPSKCYCIGEDYSEKKKSMEKKCTTPCLYPPDVACGDKNGSYVSVYRLNKNASTALVKDTDSADESEANCLTFNPSVGDFMWKKCRQSLQFECYTGHNALYRKEQSSWLEAADRCFQTKTSPTSFENTESVINISASFLWTGLMRSRIIHQYNGNSLDKGVFWETQFGFLTKTSSNEYLLKFETDSTTRRILCQTAETTDTKNPTSSFIVIGVIVIIVVVGVVSASAIVYSKKRKMGICHRKEVKTDKPGYSYAEFPFSAERADSQQSNNYYILEPHEREVAPSYDLTNINDNKTSGVQDREGCVKEGPSVSYENDGLATQRSTEGKCKENEYNRLDMRTGEKRKYTDNVYDCCENNQHSIRNGENVNCTDNVYNRLDTQK